MNCKFFYPPLKQIQKCEVKTMLTPKKLRGHDSLDKHSQNQHVLIIKDLKGVGFGWCLGLRCFYLTITYTHPTTQYSKTTWHNPKAHTAKHKNIQISWNIFYKWKLISHVLTHCSSVIAHRSLLTTHMLASLVVRCGYKNKH